MAKVSELKLADTVRVSVTDWGTAIVQNITATDVVFFRPYGVTANFSYTGGVICYVGIETYSVPLSSDMEFEILTRKELK